MTLFIVSSYVFVRRQMTKGASLSLPMTVTAVCMILCATAQLSVDTANVFVAFLHRSREERLRYLSDTSTKLFSAKHCITITQLLIGDSFVVRFMTYIVFSDVAQCNPSTDRAIDVGSCGAGAYGS